MPLSAPSLPRSLRQSRCGDTGSGWIPAGLFHPPKEDALYLPYARGFDGYPKIRFHNLRRTFVITTLEYGIGAKTLSAVVGHRSSSTTLNVYTYVTKVIERQTAAKIDQRIGKQRTPLEEAQETKRSTMTTFRADSGSAPGMSTATLRESVRRS